MASAAVSTRITPMYRPSSLLLASIYHARKPPFHASTFISALSAALISRSQYPAFPTGDARRVYIIDASF